MVNIPTNYKMGSGLAATIMGQQAGLEAESQGLANLTKAMQMPQEALKGQEAAMLMQNPEYLQQKTANTLIELGNTYNANQFQQSLNEFGRVKLELQAATGNPEKQQQIVLRGLQALNMSPDSEFGQYALANPDKAIDQLIQGTEAAMVRTGGAKQLGAEKLAGIKGENALELAQIRGDIQKEVAGIRAAGGGGRDSSVVKARNKILTAGPQNVVNYAGAALKTGIDPLTKQPIDDYDRQLLQAYYDEAQATLNSKGGGSEIQLPGGGKISSSKGGRVPPGQQSGGKASSAADEASSKGF